MRWTMFRTGNTRPSAWRQPCRLHIESLEERNLLDGTPLLDSWLRGVSGEYAQAINGWDVASGPSSTWPDYVPRGAHYNGGQSTPVEGDLHYISFSDNWVYVQAPGLASYVMGPWFQPNGQVFPNFPSDQNQLVRITQDPQPASGQHDINGLGPVGIWANGVAMFNMLDGFSWSHAQQQDLPSMGGGGGDGFWNRDANQVEAPTFDNSGAHQPQSGQYHYHSDPVALRAQLGDNIAYTGDAGMFPYDSNILQHPPTTQHTLPFEEDTSSLHHSPILGWSFDGYPVYGPYGYSNPLDPTSAIRPMVSSYRLRDITKRTTLPGWAAQLHFGDNVRLDRKGEYHLPRSDFGPPVSAQYPLGWYTEDYEYVAGLGDLDQYNGRWCVTPEFPQGTYAYFVTIDAQGEPAFPYYLGREYYGQATSGRVRSITEPVTVVFDIHGTGPGADHSTQTSAAAVSCDCCCCGSCTGAAGSIPRPFLADLGLGTGGAVTSQTAGTDMTVLDRSPDDAHLLGMTDDLDLIGLGGPTGVSTFSGLTLTGAGTSATSGATDDMAIAWLFRPGSVDGPF